MIKGFLAAVSLFTASTFASAMVLDGTTLPEQQQVHGQELQLNGAGARSAMGSKIYLAALYLPSKSQDGLRTNPYFVRFYGSDTHDLKPGCRFGHQHRFLQAHVVAVQA